MNNPKDILEKIKSVISHQSSVISHQSSKIIYVIIQSIFNGTKTDKDIETLRQWLNSGGIQNLQVGKYNVNIEQGQDIQIGDRTYQGLNAEAIREVTRAILQGYNAADVREVVRSIKGSQ